MGVAVSTTNSSTATSTTATFSAADRARIRWLTRHRCPIDSLLCPLGMNQYVLQRINVSISRFRHFQILTTHFLVHLFYEQKVVRVVISGALHRQLLARELHLVLSVVGIQALRVSLEDSTEAKPLLERCLLRIVGTF